MLVGLVDRLARLILCLARLIPRRDSGWPEIARSEFAWLTPIGMTDVTVSRHFKGDSVRFEGDRLGLVLFEGAEEQIGMGCYIYRRRDDDDARNMVWLLQRAGVMPGQLDLGPRDAASLAAATHQLSVALERVIPELDRVEREGGSAW